MSDSNLVDEQDQWLASQDPGFMHLCDQQEEIETREDFVAFVEALRDDFQTHQSWENPNIYAYLDALASFTQHLDQHVRNLGEILPAQPTWKIIGYMLLAARKYE